MREINIDRLQELLGKLNIPLYLPIEGNRAKSLRNILDILRDLSQFWDVLSKEYKDDIYKSIGLSNNQERDAYINDTDC